MIISLYISVKLLTRSFSPHTVQCTKEIMYLQCLSLQQYKNNLVLLLFIYAFNLKHY